MKALFGVLLAGGIVVVGFLMIAGAGFGEVVARVFQVIP